MDILPWMVIKVISVILQNSISTQILETPTSFAIFRVFLSSWAARTQARDINIQLLYMCSNVCVCVQLKYTSICQNVRSLDAVAECIFLEFLRWREIVFAS